MFMARVDAVLCARTLSDLGDDGDCSGAGKQSGDLDQPTVSERQRIPRHLLAIVLKAVAAERSARYASITELLGTCMRFRPDRR
jgi:hypothetical protein